MGIEAIGYILGQQCAPVLAGVKPSNLFIVEKGNQSGLSHVLKGTQLHRILLYTSEEKDYWLLYEPEELGRLMDKAENAAYLRDCGYEHPEVDAVLARLSERFCRYKRTKQDFPHEMGVLFGYPLKDVKGFVENRGKNFKLSGYWKVYDDVDYDTRLV